jgi:hypothetical protein
MQSIFQKLNLIGAHLFRERYRYQTFCNRGSLRIPQSQQDQTAAQYNQ